MTTPTLPQAAQIALDALVLSSTDASRINPHQQHVDAAITALREALAQPQAEPVDQQIESINAVFDAWRNGEDASMTLALSAPPADGDRVEAAIDDYIDGYVMEGDDGYYQPNDGDTAMLKDAMMGLLVDPGFLAAYDGTPPAAPQAVPAPAVREPLTDGQLAKIAVEDEFLLYCDQDSFNEIARAIEAHHGIGTTGGGK